MRVVEEAEGDAPVRDRAGGIGLERLLEDFARRAVPERVLIAHAAIEASLCDLVARSVEVHRTEALVRLFLTQRRMTQENGGGCRNGEGRPACCHGHCYPLSIT